LKEAVKLVYNLGTDLWPKVEHLFDYVLLRPGNYKTRDSFDVPAFLETEFRGKINLYEQARKQLDVARDGDILIAPDVLNDRVATIKRIEAWRDFMHDRDFDGKKLEVLYAPQGANPKDIEWCLGEYLTYMHSDYVGIGIFTIKNAMKRGRNAFSLKLGKAIKANGRKLHLLGWSLTIHESKVPVELYRMADTLDSQGIFGYIFKYGQTLDENMRWIRPRDWGAEKLYIHALENAVAYWDRVLSRRSLRD